MNGVATKLHWNAHEEAVVIERVQDVEPILEANKRQFNGPHSRFDDFRHVARIPNVLVEKWLKEEGINVLDKDHAPAVMRKLNSPEYAYLRTRPGRL